jgi:cytochrome c peroxidase
VTSTPSEVRRWLWRAALVASICTGLAAAAGPYADNKDAPHDGLRRREPLAPLPPPPALDALKVELGRRLFSDTILSGDGARACASCHDLNAGGTVHVERMAGYTGKMNAYNPPTVFNAGNSYRLGWRGNFTSLEELSEKVLLDANLMAANWQVLLQRLRASDLYAPLFERAFGRRPDPADVIDALATFQRSLITPGAPFDRYLGGDLAALTQDEAAGYALFKSRGCASCHQGSNIGGNMFQRFGIFAAPTRNTDAATDAGLGRWTITGAERDKRVFRVPSLRNVEVTAPYFHDGQTESLPEAVVIMARSQLGRELPATEVSSIVAFLKTLTGYYNGHRLTASPTQERP